MIVTLVIVGVCSFTFGAMIGWYVTSIVAASAIKRVYAAAVDAVTEVDNSHRSRMETRIKAKIAKVSEIHDSQMHLWQLIDGPNKGAAHSKGRRDLIHQINDLEGEKVNIFREILADGADLTVKVAEPGGGLTDKKMSEIIQEYDEKEAKNKPFVKPVPSVPTKPSHLKVVKDKPNLSIIKDKKDD